MVRILFAAVVGVLAGANLSFAQGGLPALTPLAPAPCAEAPQADALINVDGVLKAPGFLDLQADYGLWGVIHKKFNGFALSTNGANGPVRDTLGEERLDNRVVSGARVTAGYWWTEKNDWLPRGEVPILGVETRFFFLGDRTFSFADSAASTFTPSGVPIAGANAPGRISGSATSQLWGAEANLWKNIYYYDPGTTCTLEAMIGLRYLNRDTNADLSRFSQFLPGPGADFPTLAGSTITESASFSAHNHFYGGQVGLRGRYYICPQMVVSGEVGFGLGVTHEVVNIQGSQTITTGAGATAVPQAALPARADNTGRFSRNQFAQVPQGSITLGFPVTDCLTLSGGMTVLYWSRIVRVGDQLNNSSGGVPFNQADLWLVGGFVSAEVKW